MITEGIREEVDKTVVMIAGVVARSIARLKQAIKKPGTLTWLTASSRE